MRSKVADVGHHGLAQESAQQRHLLRQPTSTVAERRAERLVLDSVPTESDAEAEPSLGQQVDLGGLLGHERRLALGQDDHPGHQLEPGARGEIAEQHEGLVERRGDVVRTAPRGVRLGIGAEHVVVRQQVGEPERLDLRSRTGARRRPRHPPPSAGTPHRSA